MNSTIPQSRLRTVRQAFSLPKIAFLALWLMTGLTAHAQDVSDARRRQELLRLRDQLELVGSPVHSDLMIVMSDRAVIEAGRQMVGMEFALANGNVLRITSFEGELKTAAAVVRIGVRAKSRITVNLLLTGRLGTGETTARGFRIPFQITKVTSRNSKFTWIFLRTLFGEWLTPAKWNKELPPLEVPLELSETLQIPSNRLEVAGSVPMEIITPAYRTLLQFVISSFLVLDKRLVLGLHSIEGGVLFTHEPSLVMTSAIPAASRDLLSLENEINRLASGLTAEGDLRMRFSRRLFSRLLEKIAASENVDFRIRLRAGRLRQEEVGSLVKVVNFTDVESGQGQADISQLMVDRIADGLVILRLSGQGTVDARVRGREYGIPYRLSPRTTFTIKDRTIPLKFITENDKVALCAAPGSQLPIDLRFSISLAGRDLGINRQSIVEADSWLKRIELPTIFGGELELPRRMEIDSQGGLRRTSSQKVNYLLSRLRVGVKDDAINFNADIIIHQ